MFPAFKEWQIIVDALGSGDQVLILRKGGIAEGRAGFDAARANRFWLFPTRFHAQREKTKPSASHRFVAEPAATTTIELRYFADVVRHRFIDNWAAVAELDTHHLWSESAVREKYDWVKPPGLHAFVLRVHQLSASIAIPMTPDMGGCKSWIELPVAFDAQASSPVLNDIDFTTRVAVLPI
jgi:hypothetical protein